MTRTYTKREIDWADVGSVNLYKRKHNIDHEPFKCPVCDMLVKYTSKYVHLKSRNHSQNLKIYKLSHDGKTPEGLKG